MVAVPEQAGRVMAKPALAMSSQYNHRNGETDAPTESGWYWFSGEHDGVIHAGLIHVVSGIKHPEAWPTWNDGWSYLSEYQGQWWGPLTPPWRG